MYRYTSGNAVSVILTTLCGIVLEGCVQVPKLQPIANSAEPKNNPKSISINEVVKRVKCEIYDSIKERPERKYPWFNKWAVQADLTLTVNDSSGISPGATITQPLNAFTIPGKVTNFGQSFNLGIGGGVTTTAFRTEIVSFTVSMADIRKEFAKPAAISNSNDCLPYGVADLTGNLGLREWVDSAFGPIDENLLREGDHKTPKAPTGTQGGAPPSLSGSTGTASAAAQFNITGAKALLNANPENHLLIDSLKNSQNIDHELLAHKAPQVIGAPQAGEPVQLPLIPNEFPDSAKKTTSLIFAEFDILIDLLLFNNGVQSDIGQKFLKSNLSLLLSNASSDYELLNGLNPTDQASLKRLGSYFDKANSAVLTLAAFDLKTLATLSAETNTQIAQLAKQINQELGPLMSAIQLICDCNQDTTEVSKKISDFLKCLKTIQTTVQAILPKSSPKDPPIDAISHQVNFVVAWNGSLNPSWTLVNFKGPTPSSGNFASLSESNTHNLTIVMGQPGSAAVANSRSSLTFSAAFANQLAPQLLQGASPAFVP
jgi:hypothetical protein